MARTGDELARELRAAGAPTLESAWRLLVRAVQLGAATSSVYAALASRAQVYLEADDVAAPPLTLEAAGGRVAGYLGDAPDDYEEARSLVEAGDIPLFCAARDYAEALRGRALQGAW